MPQQLFPHQATALDEVKRQIVSGIKALAVMMPTGSGKTAVASRIMAGAEAKGHRAYFVVDSVELVDQAFQRFTEDGISVGVIQGQNRFTDYSQPVQVATIQTLRNRWPEIAEANKPAVVVIDECFVAGTQVKTQEGNKPIETIKPGDVVANAAGWGEVTATSEKTASQLVEVELSDGSVITCTSNHPFFTSAGWVEAEALAVGSRLYREEDLRALRGGVRPEDLDGEGRLLEVVRVDRYPGEESGRGTPVFNLQVAGHPSYFAEGVLAHNCHVLHKAHEEIIEECKARGVPVLGLSATPFRRGMGQVFDSLVVGATTQQLTDEGYLCPATCYAPYVPDLAGVKTRHDGDFQEDALAEFMGDAKIVGDVVTSWFSLAEGRQTLVFAATVAHSRELCDAFRRAGVEAAHIDGYEHDPVRRREVIEDFRAGRIRVLCNVAVLTKGFDAPETDCIVMARPTKSLMLHYQMMGRGLRTTPGKVDCLILDHSGNCLRNGTPTDPLPDHLDDGESQHKLDRRKRDKTDPVKKPCQSCGYVSSRHECPACGFKPEKREDVEVRDGELYEIGTQTRPRWSREGVRTLYAELLGHAQLKGFKKGWAWHTCKEFTGTAPRDTRQIEPMHPSSRTLGIIKHMRIKKAKAAEKQRRQEVAS